MQQNRLSIRSYGSPLDLLLEDLYLLADQTGIEDYKRDECIEHVRDMLKRSGHLARARSVAYMAAFCRYLARLVEGYGVSIMYAGVVPGKGSMAHKMLAKAVHILYDNYGWRLPAANDNPIEVAVKKAREELESSGSIPLLADVAYESLPEPARKDFEKLRSDMENRIKEAEETARELLRQLYRSLPIITERLGLSLSSLRPLTELQLVDYSLRVIGTPDLILEDEARRRAIVVEWKTYRTGVMGWEMAQAYIYAMIELRRLGYGGHRMDIQRNFASFVNTFIETDPRKVAAYPVIIRLNGPYSTHPALPLTAKGQAKQADLEAVLRILLVSAYHLVALLSYSQDAWQSCQVEASKLSKHLRAERVALYRYTPPTITDRMLRERARFPAQYAGNPKTQDKYPCDVCRKMFPPAASACRVYFGRGIFDKLERLMYSMRNAILERHANDMLIYKVLYEASIRKLLEAERSRQVLIYDGTKVQVKPWAGRAGGPAISVQGGGTYRFNFFNELRVPLMPEPSDTLYLTKYSVDRLASSRIVEEDLEVVEVPLIRIGKPVAVFIVDSEERPIPLNIGVFARVSDHIYDEEKPNQVSIELGIPSPSLRFSIEQLAPMLRYYGCKPVEDRDEERTYIVCSASDNRYILGVEVSVDLTHYDLRALDLSYRAILKAVEDSGAKDKDIDEGLNNMEKMLDRIFSELYEGLVS